MRSRFVLAAVFVIAIVAGIGGWRLWSSSQSGAPVAPTPAPVVAEASASAVAATDSPSASPSDSVASPAPESSDASALASTETSASPETSESPSASESPGPSASPAGSPSPTPTVAPEPTGLKPGWELPAERTAGGPEADLLVRTGDINNLGFGWPAGFTPFSGKSTPAHPYPCTTRYGAVPGTDRIMLGTGVTPADLKTRSGDGYAGCTTRPDNIPKPITIAMGALPAKIHVVLVQMFLDDFQSPVWHSHFQVSLGGTRIPTFEDTINAMDQTGPIGKLVTLRLLPEYWPLLRKGDVDLYIDDPTTGALDGYAIDFVRVLVNPHTFPYAVSIACTVVDAATQKPIAGATVTAAQVTMTTGSGGTATLRGVPAGLASAGASAVGYDSQVQLVDLVAGDHGTARFELHRHSEGVADLKAQIAKNGKVAIYGIHFDTASATLRPDSTKSLETILALVKSSPGSRWVISGHTDNQGGADYNLGLSDARAKSVVAWLASHGVAADRFVAKGYGLTRPVADNATESGRALNRRVEVELLK